MGSGGWGGGRKEKKKSERERESTVMARGTHTRRKRAWKQALETAGLQCFPTSLHPFIPLWLWFNPSSLCVFCSFVSRRPPTPPRPLVIHIPDLLVCHHKNPPLHNAACACACVCLNEHKQPAGMYMTLRGGLCIEVIFLHIDVCE